MVWNFIHVIRIRVRNLSNRVKDFPNSRVSERECVKMCWTRDVSLEEEADGPLSLIYMSALVPTLMCVGMVLLILAVAGYYVHNYFMAPGATLTGEAVAEEMQAWAEEAQELAEEAQAEAESQQAWAEEAQDSAPESNNEPNKTDKPKTN